MYERERMSLAGGMSFFKCLSPTIYGERNLIGLGIYVMNIRVKCQTVSRNNPKVANKPSGGYFTDC